MTAKILRQTYLGQNEIRFADPNNHADTARIAMTVQPKKAGSRTVHNVNTRVTAVRNVVLPAIPGCDDKCKVDSERLSLQVSISGSSASGAEVRTLLADMKQWLAVIEDDIVKGFLPIGKGLVINTQD